MRLRVPAGRFCLYVRGISSALFHLCERGLGGVIYWRGNSWENRLLYHAGNMKSSSPRARPLVKVLTSDSQRGIACGASARGPPLERSSSDAKQPGHSGVRAVPRRAHIHGRQTMYRSAPLGKKRFGETRSQLRHGAVQRGPGMLPPTSKWVISARGRNDPFFACGATHALLARIVGLWLD